MDKCVVRYSNTMTLEQVLEALDKGGMGILVFVSENEKLIGIITDGDIRRGLLRKKTSIDQLINPNPETMHADTPKREVAARLKSIHRRHMPLIDDEKKLKRVFSLDDIEFTSRPNKVVIMVGGLGSRLGELTKDTPKPMLKVGDRPMLLHLVNMFSEYGFRRFVFCVNYKKEVIKEFFGSGEKFGIEIEYVEETERLGTAGALALAKQLLVNDFFVINGDVVVNVDLEDVFSFHIESESVATMCVTEYNHQVPYGVVKTDMRGEITAIEEKPLVSFNTNAGIYVLSPKSIQHLNRVKYLDIPDLFKTLIDSKERTKVYQVEESWYDVGRKEDLFAAHRALSPSEE